MKTAKKSKAENKPENEDMATKRKIAISAVTTFVKLMLSETPFIK